MSTIQNYIDRNSENPTLVNALRGRSLNKTTLAELANVGYSVVHRCDMFLYDSLPPKLLRFMEQYDLIPSIDWETEYLHDKQDMLALHKEQFEHLRPKWLYSNPAHYSQTFIEWREANFPSQMDFGKVFLMNPVILANYENGTTKNLPVVIKERLLYFGMKTEYVSTLNQFPRG